MKYLFVTIASASLLLTACGPDLDNDNDSHEFTGTFNLISQNEGDTTSWNPFRLMSYYVEEESTEALSGARMTLYYDEAVYKLEDCCFYTEKWTDRRSLTTDTRGAYSFNVRTEDDWRYKVELNDGRYIGRSMRENQQTIHAAFQFFQSDMTITLIDHDPNANVSWSLTTNMKDKQNTTNPSISFEDGVLNSDGTLTYTAKIPSYKAFNALFDLKQSTSNHSKIVRHYTGRGFKPNPLVIEVGQ